MSWFKASWFRYANVLPSAAIEKVIAAGKKFSGICFDREFTKHPEWWKFEHHVNVLFDEDDHKQVAEQMETIAKTCGSCGMCCQQIPSHNIAIYMSPSEIRLAKEAGHEPKFQGRINVEGVDFDIMDIKENGDCIMLGEHGCTLGEFKPLWCKIYHCEKYQDKPYQFEELHKK